MKRPKPLIERWEEESKDYDPKYSEEEQKKMDDLIDKLLAEDEEE